MAVIKLESMINPEGCSAGELRENLGRLQKLLGWLDQIVEINLGSDNTTLTFNIKNVNEITANQINSGSYNDSGEIEYCFDYCPTAISNQIIKSGGGPDAEIFRNYELDEDWITWDDLDQYQQQMLLQQQRNGEINTGVLGI